jgi:hypothetical protein
MNVIHVTPEVNMGMNVNIVFIMDEYFFSFIQFMDEKIIEFTCLWYIELPSKLGWMFYFIIKFLSMKLSFPLVLIN